MKDNFDVNLKLHLRGITCEDALTLLMDEFKASNHTIVWALTQRATTPSALYKNRQYRGMDADLVGPIKFWGGPPNNRKFVKGSLLTYLCDQILMEWALDRAHRDLVEEPPKESQSLWSEKPEYLWDDLTALITEDDIS